MKRLFICFSVLFCLSTIAYAGNEVPLNHHPAGTTQVILPATLSGDFELRFETSTYYYYGYISL